MRVFFRRSTLRSCAGGERRRILPCNPTAKVNHKMQPTHFGSENEPRPVEEFVCLMPIHNYFYDSPVEQRRRPNPSQVLPDYKRKQPRHRPRF